MHIKVNPTFTTKKQYDVSIEHRPAMPDVISGDLSTNSTAYFRTYDNMCICYILHVDNTQLLLLNRDMPLWHWDEKIAELHAYIYIHDKRVAICLQLNEELSVSALSPRVDNTSDDGSMTAWPHHDVVYKFCKHFAD